MNLNDKAKTDLVLYGNVFLRVLDPGCVVVLLDGDAVGDTPAPVVGYSYRRDDGTEETIPAREVVHLKMDAPGMLYGGAWPSRTITSHGLQGEE